MTKMALMGALTVGATGAAMLHNVDANAATNIDATHVRVEAGDTLYKIAQDKGTTVQHLAGINHLSNPNQLKIDQVLTIDGDNTEKTNATSNTVNSNMTQSNQTNTYTPAANNSYTGSTTTTSAYAGNTASNTNYGNYTSSLSDNAAANAIAQAESGGSYTARNGRYVGKWQLDESYLGGDLSPQHQDQVANQYVQSRYGSWNAALAFRNSHGWY